MRNRKTRVLGLEKLYLRPSDEVQREKLTALMRSITSHERAVLVNLYRKLQDDINTHLTEEEAALKPRLEAALI
jgi:hypothetical protein